MANKGDLVYLQKAPDVLGVVVGFHWSADEWKVYCHWLKSNTVSWCRPADIKVVEKK